jgi:hypothetical protein
MLADASYEIIVDKGTVDALLCVEGGTAGVSKFMFQIQCEIFFIFCEMFYVKHFQILCETFCKKGF